MKSVLVVLFASAQLGLLAAAPALPEFDFGRPEVCAQWRAAHDISALRSTPDGLEISITANDPYLYSPPRDYPLDQPLWLTIKLKSDDGGDGQVFFFKDSAREENSEHFLVKPGVWTEARVLLPPLGAGYYLRLDPPGAKGKTTVAWIHFTTATPLLAPAWPKPRPIDFSRAPRLRAGALELRANPDGFTLDVEGRRLATSHTHPLLGYVLGDQPRWLDLAEPGPEPAQLEATLTLIQTTTVHRDPDGARWQISRNFHADPAAGLIDLEVRVEVNQDRAVTFLPMLLMGAGDETLGTTKGHGLLAGLEYLDNEPSSSEADLVGREAKRQVPANHKITFPLMALQMDGRYLGVIWNHAKQFSALFDSPDRLLGTGGHLLGVLFPGSDGFNRLEGSLLPLQPEMLRAGQLLVLRAQFIGGRGESVVPAVQAYVRQRGLPAISNSYALKDYVSLAAGGWLDSGIRTNALFRHAVWPGFNAQPAADAACFMDWLAGRTTNSALEKRLIRTAQEALSVVPAAHLNQSAVGHVRYPLASLVYGHVTENADLELTHARVLLPRFEPDGSILYRKSPGGEDYGRTHFAPDANGLTAQVVATILTSAMFAGDADLLQKALEKLHALDRFEHSAPRGAQTWEVPLHTPDILASAYLVRAYTMGYELTGDPKLLEKAVYWAWTGVPFVYLTNPVGTDDRPYGTIAVLGATGWRAPVWMGRPVQWCGLVYSDALYRLVRHDPTGPWRQLADGITATGLAYSWPPDDLQRQGLLPDAYEPQLPQRGGPAINPGTVQANAVQLYGQEPLYDCRTIRDQGRLLILHAPGAIDPITVDGRRVKFTVRGWPRQPYRVLVNGLRAAPSVSLQGQPVALTAPHEYQAATGRLVLTVSGACAIEITQGDPVSPQPALR